MRRNSRTFWNSTFNRTHGIGVCFAALLILCAVAFLGCSDDGDTTNVYEVPPATVGYLNVNVSPPSTKVVVTGPDDFSQTFTGNQLLTDLEPGQYLISGTAPGFADQINDTNVEAGQTSTIYLALHATAIITDAPRTVYRNEQGNLIPLDTTDINSGQLVFHAWLEDEASGIITTNLTSGDITDPGRPLVEEQQEVATSFTQNLACAWVGYKDATGDVRPVIGADVRWEIDQLWSGRVNSMQFGTSDDNRIADNYGVFDDQADTRTNNARLETERFPFTVTEFPLYNMTGIGTPFIDGLTWVTLFSPDATADGRIVAVATVNGEEIGKQILYKSFAPTPKLEITKTVDKDVVNLVGGSATVNWTVTVDNVGNGDATKVDLKDILLSGPGSYSMSYLIDAFPEDSNQVDDGFTSSFPLPSSNAVTFEFKGTVTESGEYCNEAQVMSYSAGSNEWTPVDLKALACFTALESNLSIIKDFVDADDNTKSLGNSLTVAANEPANLRVRVVNNGTGSATGVQVNDMLTSDNLSDYTLISVSSGTPNSNGGFDTEIGSLAAGATTTLLFEVSASEDGEYCDTATVTATSGTIGIGSDSACLTVATPNITITKTDAPKSVLPGATYTSTIVVKNDGSATAEDVVISDTIGLNPDGDVRAIYVSSSLNGIGGALVNNVVTADMVDLPAGQSMTFTVVSRIPLGAASGTYCDTATVESSNAGTKEASDCVDVPAYSALQTALTDESDPIAVNSDVEYFSVLYVESLSNEGVGQNKMTFSFGLVSPTTLGIPGVFQVKSTNIYLDRNPVIDPVTGYVVSDASNPTAMLQSEGVDYTLETQLGKQVITMTPDVVLQPDTALYVDHVTTVPSGTPSNKMYTTSYIWTSVGLVDPDNHYEASSSEPTTVLP